MPSRDMCHVSTCGGILKNSPYWYKVGKSSTIYNIFMSRLYRHQYLYRINRTHTSFPTHIKLCSGLVQ
ncbi:hypothetical protein XELAEV_18004304mg [Xenopus laevis]|uniref:Uncharacterized protein n=1 Tax=Xenopus laevis TaxID=8355 RepID=A0A974GY20_XENLA|nr:hypothetical protein XELAEV_18004304mg [Xenopus laevis]